MSLTHEQSSDEVPAASLLDVLQEQFDLMTGPARVHVSLTQLRTHRLGRWIVVTVQCTSGAEITVRISARWAQTLKEQLRKVLPE